MVGTQTPDSLPPSLRLGDGVSSPWEWMVHLVGRRLREEWTACVDMWACGHVRVDMCGCERAPASLGVRLLNSHEDSGFPTWSSRQKSACVGLTGCASFRLKAPSCILEAPGAPRASLGDRDAPPGQAVKGAVRGRWRKTPHGSPGPSGRHYAPVVCVWAALARVFHKYCLFPAASLPTISRGWQPRVARAGARAAPACSQRLASRAHAPRRGLWARPLEKSGSHFC